MGADNKVVWLEGMFLRPQHFQQHDRYIERLVRSRVAGITPFSYGLSELRINRELLIGGKFGAAQARGVLPDGTPFDIMADNNPPVPLEIDRNVRNEIVYLTLPEQQPGAKEIAANGQDSLAARFSAVTYNTFDSIVGFDTTADIEVGKLKLKYALESSERSGYVCLGLARIVEVRNDNTVTLDEHYIPPTLSCAVTPPLSGFITELKGLLHQRGDEFAGRASQAGVGVGEMANFLMLQFVNRYEPLMAHYETLTELHPVTLYGTLLEIAGEFSTFMSRNRRPANFPAYRHDDLQSCFGPLIANLKELFSGAIMERAISIPLQEKAHGIRIGMLGDKRLLDTASFVVAAKADMPTEQLRRDFPALAKIGPVERIARLVNERLPGIPIRALPVAPRQIPFHLGTVYFELDRSTQLWSDLKTSGAFAFHISGDFPGLVLEFWAIRS